jgi:hypothetical protein
MGGVCTFLREQISHLSPFGLKVTYKGDKNMRNRLFLIMTLMLGWIALIGTQSVDAQIYTGRTSTRQVDNLLRRIETRTDTFKRDVETSLDNSRLNNTNREDRIADFIRDFETATDALRQRFNARQNVNTEVNEVLSRALFIDRFMNRNQLSYRAESGWTALRTDLNTLASYYSMTWDWNRQPNWGNYPDTNFPSDNTPRGRFDRLTGTYRLNVSQSDNVSEAIDRSLGRSTAAQNDRMRSNLERRLTSPDMLAIERNNRTITVASSLAPQVTFDADGVAKTETNARGRTIRTTASVTGGSLNVAYEGDRTNDFYLTFMPVGNNQLRVTRRLYRENSGTQITVTSVYDKVSDVAQWSTVNTGSTWVGNTGNTTYTDFYIPNGTRLIATLQNRVDTKVSQIGDRVTMEVVSPNQYRGVIIEGRVSQVGSSGRLSGRANVSFDFDTIRLTNGQSYRFAGIIDSVRAANGDNVSVNNEGAVRDSNQTTKTATRAGIGAALGALIGAIAGGGSGAAIGAAVGAGAGAGTVLVQGRDSVVLEQGSEFNITASAPNIRGD